MPTVRIEVGDVSYLDALSKNPRLETRDREFLAGLVGRVTQEEKPRPARRVRASQDEFIVVQPRRGRARFAP